MARFNVYRFRDKVAITPPEGDTVYLPLGIAEILSNALSAVIVDVESNDFTNSAVGTLTVEFES